MAETRTEEWTHDMHGMLTTVLVQVRDGEVVHVSEELMDEFGLPREKEVVEGFARPRFVWEVPVATVKERLVELGWSYAGTA